MLAYLYCETCLIQTGNKMKSCINRTPVYSEHNSWFLGGSVYTGLSVYISNKDVMIPLSHNVIHITILRSDTLYFIFVSQITQSAVPLFINLSQSDYVSLKPMNFHTKELYEPTDTKILFLSPCLFNSIESELFRGTCIDSWITKETRATQSLAYPFT